MRTDDFDYELPPDLIAQTPHERGASRLLVLHKTSGTIEHRQFNDIQDYIHSDDLLVMNNTRVSARRLTAIRDNGAPAEVLLIAPQGTRSWRALVRPGRSFKPGRDFTLVDCFSGAHAKAVVSGLTPDGGRILDFENTSIRDSVADWGETPLPPYIKQKLPRNDEERYQTIYGSEPGSAAAPTAGLHFTSQLLDKILQTGARTCNVTLEVGVATFRPVKSDDVNDHEMHFERIYVPASTAHAVNCCRGKVVAVGTTTVRALESSIQHGINVAAGASDRASEFEGETNLFITPGYQFRAIDALVTNFHQPRSTLLMMISALAGRELILHAYNEAICMKYRFFSFGDAMLII